MIDPYATEITRHQRAVATIQADDRKLMELTITSWLSGGQMTKHDSLHAHKGGQGVVPVLTYNGQIVAEMPEEGLILVSRTQYPVTPLLRTLLFRRGYQFVERLTDDEDGYFTSAFIGRVLARWMLEAHGE